MDENLEKNYLEDLVKKGKKGTPTVAITMKARLVGILHSFNDYSVKIDDMLINRDHIITFREGTPDLLAQMEEEKQSKQAVYNQKRITNDRNKRYGYSEWD